ncbi:MAG: Rrf2 family transcriptional regulator [Candidatus Omnitrophota bacterium]
MLNQTTETAIKVLIYLVLKNGITPISPKNLADELSESPSYLAKITGLLVKAGILRAFRGMSGGVILHQKPGDITLLDIVEVCQGKILGNYCQETDQVHIVCAYHQAMYQIHEATTAILKQWTLADLAANPVHSFPHSENMICRMMGVCPKSLRKL